MNNNFIEPLPNDNPMLYYLLPSVIKRRCRALKKISLEHEKLEMKHKRLRRQVCNKYLTNDDHPTQMDSSHREFICPFNLQSLRLLAKKADELKELVTSEKALNTTRTCATNFNSIASVRNILDACESKCHELLTHLANIDWELYEFEESLALYNADIEEAMTEYNMELSALYKRRLGIIQGEHEPTDDECILPNYLNNSNPPKYLNTERSFEQLFSIRYSLDAELMVGQQIKGVPEFWFQSMLIALKHIGVIEFADYGPLKYLVDVRYYYDTECDHHHHHHNHDDDDDSNDELLMSSDHRTQVLLFYFDKNPHFSNRILSKTLHIDKSCRSGHQMFDGLCVSKKEGCTINWFQGQDLTSVFTMSNQDRNQAEECEVHDNDTTTTTTADIGMHRWRRRFSSPRTFFNFFSANGLNNCGSARHKEQTEPEMDYDVFVRFRDFIVPHAIVAYSRGNLFGFECEHDPDDDQSLSQKMHYLNTLFDSPG